MSDAAVLVGKLLIYAAIAFFFSRFRKGGQSAVATRVIVWLLLAPATFIAFAFALHGGFVAVATFAVTCIIWLGGPIATRVATPAGLPRVASVLAAAGSLPYHVDGRGSGQIAAARSCLVLRHRGQELPERALARLERRIVATKVLRPGTITARAYCCLVLGDRDQAKLLFKSVGDFAPSLRAGPAQVFAARWLVAEAACRGDWTALQHLPKRLNTTLTQFAAVCATRIAQGPALVPKSRLLDRWLVTSSRLGSLPLLRLAWSATEPRGTPGGESLLARHVAALRGHARADDVLDLANAWQGELEQVPEIVRGAVLDDLLALADKHPELRGRHPFFSSEGGDALRAFEIAADALARRIADERWLPPIEEWSELAMLRDLYEELALDPARRRLAFDTVRHLITNYAADLFNTRAQKPMANALFLWMEREARWAQDDDIFQINKKNIACGF